MSDAMYYIEKNGPRDYRVYSITAFGGRGASLGMYTTKAAAKIGLARLYKAEDRAKPKPKR